MTRRIILAAVLGTVVAFAAITPAVARTDGTSTKVVYKSYQCKAAVARYEAGTWACTTITVQPWQVSAGTKTKVTYSFKAKKDLAYLNVCFSRIGTSKCAYSRRVVTLRRGQAVTRTIMLSAPNVTTSGVFPLENYTRFYKPPTYISRNAYWIVRHANVCVVTAEDTNFKCPGGTSRG